MSERGRPLSLWGSWWNAIELVRPAFSRLSTFLWFATIVAGMTVRTDMLGVTSIVRALNLRPTLYHRLSPLSQHRRQARPARRAVGCGGVAAVPDGASHQRPADPGRRRPQMSQARQENAGRQATASAIGRQHQARIHHGAFVAGRQPAGPRGAQLLRRTARRTHP